jgi:hypothetical protein
MKILIYNSRIVIPSFVFLLGLFLIAMGQETSKCNPECNSLLRIVDKKGRINIIITLNSSLIPESEILSDDEKVVRRTVLNQIEHNFVNRLNLKLGVEVLEEGRKESEPMLFLRVDKDLLQSLIDDNEVRKIDMPLMPKSNYRERNIIHQ